MHRHLGLDSIASAKLSHAISDPGEFAQTCQISYPRKVRKTYAFLYLHMNAMWEILGHLKCQ